MFDLSRENIDLIKADLKEKLPKKRYEHTLGVAYTAAALAMCYGEDILKEFYMMLPRLKNLRSLRMI